VTLERGCLNVFFVSPVQRDRLEQLHERGTKSEDNTSGQLYSLWPRGTRGRVPPNVGQVLNSVRAKPPIHCLLLIWQRGPSSTNSDEIAPLDDTVR
jgi:hypothetical protein